LTEKIKNISLFVGIDVQIRRGCTYAVLDSEGSLIDSGWSDKWSIVRPSPMDQTISVLERVIKNHSKGIPESVAVGIDAPRMPLPEKRKWYWERKARSWRPRKSSEAGFGRHCEIVIKAHSVGNPQWTPLASNTKPWMALGFKLFQALASYPNVHEVFPSASYIMLEDNRDVNIQINFAQFAFNPKDMLDACLAAATVREFIQGRGEQVGGGDGFGTIVLPRPIIYGRMEEIFSWPEEIS
jgi:predicted nuclease with RNAse H fold